VVLENARRLNDAAGRHLGYEGSVANITERKRAEQAIFAEKERAQVTLQSIGDAVISTDAEGRIEYINPVAERLTAWTLAEARGQPMAAVLNLVNEITREPLESSLDAALGRGGGGGAHADHAVLVTRAAEWRSVIGGTDLRPPGEVIGAVVVFHDVLSGARGAPCPRRRATMRPPASSTGASPTTAARGAPVGAARRQLCACTSIWISSRSSTTSPATAGDRLPRDVWPVADACAPPFARSQRR
jgi:hypothetical protein